MAWTTIGTTNLTNSKGTVGYVYLQYDNSSTGGTSWPCRLYAGEKSGSSFTVNFNSVVMDGQNLGNHTGITKNTVVATWNSTGGRSISGSWTCPWYASYGGTRSYTISGTLPAKATAPSGGTGSLVSRTWNTITTKASVSSWGTNYTGTPNLAQCICVSTASSSNWLSSARQVKWTNTTATSVEGGVTTANSTAYDGGVTIKGCMAFKVAGYGSTNIGETWTLVDTVYYTPPAPLASITQSQTRGSTNVSISAVITGGNSTNNYNETVTTYWRYSTNGGSSWSGWGNAGTGSPWTAKTVTFTAAYGASIKVEAYQSYKSLESQHTTISFTALSAETPSNLASSITASTWNSVTMSGSCTYNKPDGISGRSLTVGVNINGTSLANRREKNTQNVTSVSGVVINNSSSNLGGDFALKGMLAVYPYAWASNTINSNSAIGSVYYLPPAPGMITYVEPPVGDTQYSVYYNGVAANNVTNYDASELRRTVRYKLAGDANWTVVVDNAIVGLTTTTGFNINIPAQSSATVEGWLTYRGKNSEVSSALLTNSSDPVYIYGSVGGETKQVHHIYGSVNGETKKIRRVYASVNGVARKVFEDGS